MAVALHSPRSTAAVLRTHDNPVTPEKRAHLRFVNLSLLTWALSIDSAASKPAAAGAAAATPPRLTQATNSSSGSPAGGASRTQRRGGGRGCGEAVCCYAGTCCVVYT